ncbi:MAG: putative 4-mercaptohistidine N1-methyltransferase [Chthoniobacteraceae bacterium]
MHGILAAVNPYETDKLVAEYLLFHYGAPHEVMPWEFGPASALNYPARCVRECVDIAALPQGARALDIGCAVGRSSFEFARNCTEVIGIDYSHRFVEVAATLARVGAVPYERTDEGSLTTPLIAGVPSIIARERVSFEHGDAQALRESLESFDVVLAANLIDRLLEPARFLARLPDLVRPGGQLVITSPYTWLGEFTPAENWLGGFSKDGARYETLDGLSAALSAHFDLVGTKDLPFLIREHSRKFQWSVAQASMWRRK